MSLLKNLLNIILINSILFLQIAPVHAMQTSNLIPDNPLEQAVVERTYSHSLIKNMAATVSFDDVTLEIPPLALKTDTVLTMEKLYNTETLKTTMANVTSGAAAYRIGPDGLKFNSKIKITIPFDRHIVESEAALRELYTWFFNTEINKWEKLEKVSINREEFTITSYTDHFTDMINSTLQLPEGPSPINFNPNSIKELKAADPGAGIPGLSGLEPSQTGGASFNIPIRIPKGRGGATPPLALSYSSELTNSWMGRGFNISTPSISIDTRMGLPDYDGRDMYMYNGEELIYTGIEAKGLRYKPRKNSTYEQIYWIRDGASDDYWEVSDKEGNIFTYGKDLGWIGPDRNDRSKSYTWYLTKKKDSNGNTVVYNYDYDSENLYTYLSSIIYSGYEGSGPDIGGKYKIEFIRDTDSINKRLDRRIDSRGKFPSKLVDRLKHINVLFDSTLVRSYEFFYGSNEFGQTILTDYSEKDKKGVEFYRYSFDYHQLPKNESDQTLGFGEVNEWDSSFNNLTKSISGSGGANLSVGVSFMGAAGVNIRGGYTYTGGINRSQMADINGDGLVDFIETKNKHLYTYLNTGNGFSADLQSIDGFGSSLNKTAQHGASFGVGANVGGAGISSTWQWSWPHADTMLMDFDGDGFIDQLIKEKSTFRKNVRVGNSDDFYFDETPFLIENSGSAGIPVLTVSELEDEDRLNKSFYQEDPLKRWTSTASGTIKVEQTATALSSKISDDGVDCRVYYKDYISSSIRLDETGQSGDLTHTFEVDKRDNLYFHLDPGKNEGGDDVQWNTQISYSDIDLLEKLNNISEIDLPVRFEGFSPIELRDLYNFKHSSDEDNDHSDRKDNWESILRDSPSLYRSVFVTGYFIPKVVTISQFEVFKDAEVPIGKTQFDIISFLRSYDYHVTDGIFIRKPSGGYKIPTYLITLWSTEDKLNCAGIKWFDGSRIYPYGTEYKNISKAFFRTLDQNLYTQNDLSEPGRMDDSGKIFIETLKSVDGDIDIFYSDSAMNHLDVNSEVENDNSLTINTSLNGYEYTYIFRDKHYLFENISPALYEGRIKDLVMGATQVHIKDFRVISAGLYNELINSLEDPDKPLYESFYAEIPESGDYELINTEPRNILLVLEKLYELTDIDGSFFTATDDLFIISGNDFSNFNDYLTGKSISWASYLEDFEDSVNGVTYYSIRTDLSDSEKQLFIFIMEDFMFHHEKFPYYQLTEDFYTIDSGLDDTEKDLITRFFQDNNIFVWKNLTRKIDYSAGNRIPVIPVKAVGGETFESIFSGFTTARSGDDIGVAAFPDIDALGNTFERALYIPQYDSYKDYSSDNLIDYKSLDFDPASIDLSINSELPFYTDPLYGGFRNWAYGIWTGYYNWDESELVDYYQKLADRGDVEESDTPPYLSYAQRNFDINDNAMILERVGSTEQISVNNETLIGNVSSYNKTEVDDQGSSNVISFKFCAFIDKDLYHPSRKGGDSIQSIPKASSTSRGDKIPYLSESKSKSHDLGGGVSFAGVGGTFGTNNGTSWQYSSILDLNGDRFPDLIKTSTNGGHSARISLGTGLGFSPVRNISIPFGKISQSSNSSVSFGGSASASEGTQKYTFDEDGKVKSNEVSGSSSGGISATGSTGSSIHQIGFLDINGDGLSDHVRRNGSGQLEVKLNLGDLGSFRDYSWNNLSIVNLWPDKALKGDQITASGISNSTFGSFGGSISIGFDSFSGSFGFNVNTNMTVSQLMDINGDGLPDLVSKKENEKFFLVQYNLGDTFSVTPFRLYREDWPEFDLEDDFEQDLEKIKDNLSGFGSKSSGSLADRSNNNLSEYGDPFKVNDTISCSKGFSINLGAFYTKPIPIPPFIIISITAGLNGTYAETSTSLSMMDINGDGLPDHVMKVPGRPLYVKLNQSGKVGLLKKVILPSGGSYELDYSTSGNTMDMPQSRNVLSSVKMHDGLENTFLEGVHTYETKYSYDKGFYNRAERSFYGFGQIRTIHSDESEQIVNYNNREYHFRNLVEEVITIDKAGFVFNRKMNHYKYTIDPSNINIKSPYLDYEQTEINEHKSTGSIKTEIQYEYNDLGDVKRMIDLGVSSQSSDNIELNISYKDLSELSAYTPSLPTSVVVENFEGEIIRKRIGDYDHYGNLISLHQYYTGSDYAEYLLSYDDYGNMINITGPRGDEVTYTYDGVVKTYVTSITNQNNRSGFKISPYISEITWDYALGVDRQNKDINGNIQIKKYDDFGRLSEIRTPYDTGSIPAVFYEYPEDTGHRAAVSYNKLRHDPLDDQLMKTVVFTDGLGRVSQTAKEGESYSGETSTLGWNVSGRILYDSKGRPVEEGQNGFIDGTELPGLLDIIHPTKKGYDVQDRVTVIELPDGSSMQTEYSITGDLLVTSITDPEANVTENYSDIRGMVRKIVKKDDKNLQLTSALYNYNILGDLLEVFDDMDNKVSFTYDLLGRNLTVDSPDAGFITSAYDNAGNLIEKTDNKLRANGQQIRYEYDGLNRLVKIDYPVMKPSLFIYGEASHAENGAGRLVQQSDESGTTNNTYGNLGEVIQVNRVLNRLTSMSNTKSATIQYKSDYLGRMEEITYPDKEIVVYEYDHGGQVTSVKGTRSGYTTTYIDRITYDEFGQRTGIRYGNGTETTYEYDPERRWLKNMNTKGKFDTTIQDISYNFDNFGNILNLENDSDQYKTNQTYVYDALYQLISGGGVFESKTHGYLEYKSSYTQKFSYDTIGNMTEKISSQFYTPSRSDAGNLNYSNEYEYYDDKPHQAERIGNMWYLYDENGNVTEEREGGHSSPGSGSGGAGLFRDGDNRWTNYGFGLDRSDGEDENMVYNRSNTWDEENRLKQSSDVNYTVDYLYDSSGERTVKNSSLGETLYFNSMWQVSMDSDGNRQSKHIYVGESRIATRLNTEGDDSYGYDLENTYYYHGDHLGSANVVTDYSGGMFEHMEYTPYGEMWVEDSDDSFDKIPFRFTAKEWDEETKLYYMSARYQNPMTSRWMSADPAGSALVNPKNQEYNIFEALNWYSYSGNNPVNYIDPSGMKFFKIQSYYTMQDSRWGKNAIGTGDLRMGRSGCAVVLMSNILSSMFQKNEALNPKWLNKRDSFFNGSLLKWDVLASTMGLNWDRKSDGIDAALKEIDKSDRAYAVGALVKYVDGDETKTHWVGVEAVVTIDKKEYIEISPTSANDTDDDIRTRDSWLLKDDKMYVETKDIQRLEVFDFKVPEAK